MTHARIPNFSHPAPVRRPVAVAVSRRIPGRGDDDLPNERLPGEVDLWHVTAPVRPDTAHVRAPRFADLAVEGLAAVVLIAGGVAAYGFLPFA